MIKNNIKLKDYTNQSQIQQNYSVRNFYLAVVNLIETYLWLSTSQCTQTYLFTISYYMPKLRTSCFLFCCQPYIAACICAHPPLPSYHMERVPISCPELISPVLSLPVPPPTQDPQLSFFSPLSSTAPSLLDSSYKYLNGLKFFPYSKAKYSPMTQHPPLPIACSLTFP